ncbi:MAG: hypothetical protein NC923_06850 [Candidatus Omnitrophica bacterium]|nr:hypothetical protein [Candidatus Omnitrophota bacterium]
MRFISERKICRQNSSASRAVWLAEAGINKALLALNNNNWTGWTGIETKFLSGTLDSAGEYNVAVDQANLTVTSFGYYPNRQTKEYYEREVEVTLSRRGLFSYAIFGNSTVTITGNVLIDSYDSRRGLYDARQAHKNGDIWTNSDQYGAINISGNASVSGQVNTGLQGLVAISENARLNGKQSHNSGVPLMAIRPPNNLVSLMDGQPIDLKDNSTLTLNTGDYKIPYINISQESRLVLNGKVRIYLTSAANSLNIKDSGKIVVNDSLVVYSDGNVNIVAGGIINNTNKPENLIIYGTDDTKSVRILWVGDFYGAVYAPAADISAGVNSQLFGSFVGDNIVYTGNGAIHYDEKLSTIGDFWNYAIISWKEY